MSKNDEIKILCTGEISVDYRLLKELQLTDSGDKLKATSDELINKLAYSIQKNGIINNLQVWQDGDDIYCFDAHHRQLALKKLEDDGWIIPEIPATRCLAKTKKQAKKLLLLKESKNSWIDEDVIQAYIDEVIDDIDIDELGLMVNFDGIDLDFDEIEILDSAGKMSGSNYGDARSEKIPINILGIGGMVERELMQRVKDKLIGIGASEEEDAGEQLTQMFMDWA